MSDAVTINRVEFFNFKAFGYLSVSLASMNVLVGPNNSGKSTILSAFRVLSAGIKRANAKSAEIVAGPTGDVFGYIVPLEDLPFSLENVHTNYDDSQPTFVKFHFSNRNTMILYFPVGGGAMLIPERAGRAIRTPSSFRREYPCRVEAIPVLGPVEHKEVFVTQQTIQRGLSTHRASRHFRNYWYQFPQDFDVFAQIIRDTWSGMDIQPPEYNYEYLMMFCKEDRIDRELYWAGFGFQVWCQLMTHIVRSRTADLLVIDEPEIYLHPDLQRRLLSILRDAGPDILLATHSTEIVSEADPSDILLIDKTKRAAQRLKETQQVQEAIDILGSNQNITLTQLARSRRVLFVEGPDDYRILGRFAQILDLPELASRYDFTVVPVEGFSQWKRIQSFAWGVENVLGYKLLLAAVFDRDYRSDEEIADTLGILNSNVTFAHIHRRKEVENYLLIPAALDRAIRKKLAEVARRKGSERVESEAAAVILDKLTTSIKYNVQGQYISWRLKHLRSKGSPLDDATINAQTIQDFDHLWQDIETRMEIVPGKEVYKALNTYLSENYGINLSAIAIISEIKREETPSDLARFLKQLERFRKTQPS